MPLCSIKIVKSLPLPSLHLWGIVSTHWWLQALVQMCHFSKDLEKSGRHTTRMFTWLVEMKYLMISLSYSWISWIPHFYAGWTNRWLLRILAVIDDLSWLILKSCTLVPTSRFALLRDKIPPTDWSNSLLRSIHIW